MPTQHSTTVGSSTAARIIACPASYKLSKGIANVESSFAAEGTMLHQVMEDILNGKYERDEDAVGYTENGHTCTQALYDEMVDQALSLFDDHFGGAEFMLEQQVKFDPIDGSFGTADVTGTHNNMSLIVDWKFGRGVNVEAEGNAQLLFCAAASRRTLSTAGFFDRDQSIVGAIIQPAMGGISKWEFTHEEVDAFEDRLLTAWKEANSVDPRLADGSHCRFCRAKPKCTVKHAKIKAVQQLAIVHTDKATTADYTADDIADWLELAEMAEDWAKSVKTLAHATLETGDVVPGWKLVAKRAARKWADEEKAVKFMKGMKFKHAEIYPSKLVTIPQAEKLVKVSAKGRKRAMTQRMATLLDLTTSISSGTTMAREDDKRHAVETTSTAQKIAGLFSDKPEKGK